MPKCLACDTEVVVTPDKAYVYVNVNIGQPGKEKPLFFHWNCFSQTIEKKSKLYREMCSKFWKIA